MEECVLFWWTAFSFTSSDWLVARAMFAWAREGTSIDNGYLIDGRHTLQLTELKGHAPNVLVPDTRGEMQTVLSFNNDIAL